MSVQNSLCVYDHVNCPTVRRFSIWDCELCTKVLTNLNDPYIFVIAVACYPIKYYSVAPYYTLLTPIALALMIYLPDNFKWIPIVILFVNLLLCGVSDFRSWKEMRAWEAMNADNFVVHPLIQEIDTNIVF